MRDQQNAVPAPVMPTQAPIIPIIPIIPQSDGGNGGPVDTRTPHQQYLDAIDANKYVGAIPVLGPVLSVMNDSYIENYEKQNPNMVVGGGLQKYSTLGRAMGRGLTVEEQLEAEKAGLGLGKVFGFGDRKPSGQAQPGYSLFDRVFGTTPMNIARESNYIGVAPNMTGGGFETGGDSGGGMTNFGGRESAVSDRDFGGYA